MRKILNKFVFVAMLSAFTFLTLNARHTYAVTTKMWANTDLSDIARGKLLNISVDGKGKFTLSPDKRIINEVPAAYVWCLVADGADSLFAGTGNPGSIFKFTHDGAIVEYYRTPEPHVQAIAIDAAGNIYAGTLPHGRIYKITSEGKGEVFCELPDPYVWDIIPDAYGNLYAATGNNGVIYKISDKGIPTVFFVSPCSNILDLVIDNDENIYAASEPQGIVYKITPDGNISVLYDAEEDEIHCLAIDKDGILYVGTSSGIPPVLHAPVPPAPPEIPLPLIMEQFPGESSHVRMDYFLSGTDIQAANQPATGEACADNGILEMPVIPEKNSIYRIDKDGRVREVFAIEGSFILCLAIDDNDNLLAGTGNKAELIRINSNKESTLLFEFSESQILDILSFKDGTKYIATGNNANIYRLTSAYSGEGVYESIIHDTTYISSWGCISWNGKVPPKTGIKLYTRSGNSGKPDNTWSDWSQYEQSGERIKSPPARFIQYRATLSTDNKETAPTLDNVNIAYLPQNQPPVIRSVEIATARQDPENVSNNKNASNISLAAHITPDDANPEDNRKYHHDVHGHEKLISWKADDPNKDRLEFDLEYKSVDESKWKELEQNIKDANEFYWNTRRIPDGNYQTKVIAYDVLDNPLEFALKGEIVSDIYLVDNTRPTITDLMTVIVSDSIDRNGRTGYAISVSGIARDEMCNITDIQYSIDSGDWQTAFPEDKIFDSKEELFLLKISYISSDEHTIVINAVDGEGNIGSSKIIFNP